MNRVNPSDAAAFAEVERTLNGAASQGIRPGLERIERLLHLLGSPQDRWPAFHVVGTNGKGSTCAFLASALRAAGCRTAFYSSPHLESPAERLWIDGEPLAGEKWLAAVRDAVAPVREDGLLAKDPPSYFELVTAAAFLLAEREGAQVGVVEAGLGGRLDATNLLGRVACSVVTSISMDHMEFLGDTLEAIAGEKFAVVRPGVPACFLGDNPALVPLFKSFCGRAGALPHVVSEEVRLEDVLMDESGCTFDFRSPLLGLDRVRTRLPGRYQLSNASLALLALAQVRDRFPGLTEQSILRGIAEARWPGRLEVIAHDPTVVLDGGHNLDGVKKLVESVRELWRGKRLGVVYAAMRDKDYRGCLSLLGTLSPALYATEVPDMERCLPAQDLLSAAAGFPWRDEPRSFASPLEAALLARRENEVVLVCGSLYLIGWVRPRMREALEVGGPRRV